MHGKMSMAWGAERIGIDVSRLNMRVLEPDLPRATLTGPALEAALAQPIASPPLAQLSAGARSALIVLSDATRIARADRILPHLFRIFAAGGIPPARVTLLIGGGNHRPPTDGEIVHIVGPELPDGAEIRIHDSSDESSLIPQPPTSRGTSASLNRLLFERDLVVTISAINAHYFAGFGGGRKSVFPGVAGREGIIANHRLAIDFTRGSLAAGVETARLDGNPVNEDICEIVARRPPDFSINTLLNPEGEIGGIWSGHWQEAHRAACEGFLRHHGVTITQRLPWALVSAGGHPKDIDLIQSHKTIQYAARAVQPGGAMLIFARCPEGLGSGGFDRFFPIADLRALLNTISRRSPKNGQTAVALYQKVREFRIGLVSELPGDIVSAIGMTPFSAPAEGIAWLRRLADGAQGYCLPHGAITLPLVAD